MNLKPTDPDIRTLFTRIQSGELDLQPDFQRSEVWSRAKKAKLIDSILRDWHIPPIHVVVLLDGRQQVLDGQQRLVAIRDFMAGALAVDGTIAPRNSAIEALDGLTYAKLPPDVRRKFEQFSIRVFNLTNYQPEEPGELFYRLNQPVTLTAAEQRNAFFGPTRRQVRDLVKLGSGLGLGTQSIGFSNARMAHDDAYARFALTLEAGSLARKITATQITDRYRSETPLGPQTMLRAEWTIRLLAAITRTGSVPTLRLNKASMHSWLCALSQTYDGRTSPNADLARAAGNFLGVFERNRHHVRGGTPSLIMDSAPLTASEVNALRLFNDRASSRVADVSSVVLRDVAIWVCAELHDSQVSNFLPPQSPRRSRVSQMLELLSGRDGWETAERIYSLAVATGWAELSS